jgi:phosphonate transport system ATP-binding protein
MPAAYELTSIRKVFPNGDMALDDISLVVGEGEHVAVIGPSGAGKTTLFRVLNLTLRPTAGRVLLGAVDVAGLGDAELRRARIGIGTIYQRHNLVGRLRVVHNVLAGNLGRWSTLTALASFLRPVRVDQAVGALDKVGIPHKLWARTDELSGGQQQRVAIARVLVQDPPVILADEPVSSVDPSLAVAIITLLRELAAESRKTLLVNLHSVDLALRFFPRIIGLREGRVHFDLAVDKVSPEALESLYAGYADEERPAELAHVRTALGGACRPLSLGA